MNNTELALTDSFYEALDKALVEAHLATTENDKAFYEGEAVAYQNAINLITNASALANSRVLRAGV